MVTNEEFNELIRGVEAGDREAANELVRLYEPEIRRAARLRLTDPEMRRLCDSMDIAQSVFGRFFSRVEQADYRINSPEDLLALLTQIARNRIIDEHRSQQTQKRGGSRSIVELNAGDVAGTQPGPHTESFTKELVELARSNLSAEELQLLDRRIEGASWEEIAEATGDSVDAVRKRLERALQRARQKMARADPS